MEKEKIAIFVGKERYMEYLVIDILILAFIYWVYQIGKSSAKPRNPAEDFWEHKYGEFKKRVINDLEKK